MCVGVVCVFVGHVFGGVMCVACVWCVCVPLSFSKADKAWPAPTCVSLGLGRLGGREGGRAGEREVGKVYGREGGGMEGGRVYGRDVHREDGREGERDGEGEGGRE